MDAHVAGLCELASVTDPIRRSKRLRAKSPTSDHLHGIQPECNVKIYRNDVRYTHNREWRCRRFAVGLGAQTMNRRLQTIVLSHTVDLDIRACVFSIIIQAVDRIKVKYADNYWQEEIEVLRLLAKDRDEFASKHLHLPSAIGKKVLNSMIQGGGIPEALEGNENAQKCIRLSRFLRWLAVTLMPDECSALLEDPSIEGAESSVLAHWWQGIEEMILAS